MFSKDQVALLLQQPEGSKLEFKKSAQFTDRIGQTFCAFANSGGGILILGVEEQEDNIHVVGVPNRDEAYQKIANILPMLDPRPKCNMEEHDVDSHLIILVEIGPLPVSELCFLKKFAFIRQGSVNVELSKRELIEFLKARGVISFEENPSNAKIEDLDERKVHKLLLLRGTEAEKFEGIDFATILTSIGVANSMGPFYIKNAGVLAFAKNIARFFLNSEIRLVKYKGFFPSMKAREFDMRLNDTLLEVLETCFSLVKDKAGISARIVNGKRIEAPMIPDRVLREALTNAVGHRDYFDPNGVLVEIFVDRIQISNPGTLLPGQTLKNFADIRRHRNPLIHRVLNDAGWGEGLNLGVKDMIRIMRQNDLPDPVFDDLGGFFRVTLYGSLSSRAVRAFGIITERQQKALAYLEKHEFITAPVFARIVGISHPTAIRDLNELTAQGRLNKIGQYRSSRYLLNKKS